MVDATGLESRKWSEMNIDAWKEYSEKKKAFIKEINKMDGIKQVTTLSVYEGNRLPDLDEIFKNQILRSGSADIIVVFRTKEP